MEYVNVKFDKKCQEKIIEGINLAANAVEVTYGPRGKNALIKVGDSLKITKDGYHTAMMINDPDPYISMGIKIVQDTCKKTADDVGDATSTSAILVREIVNNYKDYSNPIAMARILQERVSIINTHLKSLAVPISSKQDLINVATISANNDYKIGNLIADTFERVGKEGIVTFKESEEVKDKVSFSEGFQIDRGYSSSYFINTPKNTCELNDVKVYISETKMEEVKQVISLADQAVKDKQSLLLIAPEFDSEILVFLSSNLDLLHSCTIISPNNGNYRTLMINDMKALLGETSVCKKVIITKEHTTFIGCDSDTEKIKNIISEVRDVIDAGELNDFDLNFYKKRLANFTSSIATIYVGGYSQVEMKERYDRIEDAVCATQAALKEGIVAGGGKALSLCSEDIDKSCKLKEILKIPEKILDTADISYEDMIKSGVVEPYLVTKTVLENAVSTASMILTSGVAIINDLNMY